MKNKLFAFVLIVLILLPALCLASCSKSNEALGGAFDVDSSVPKNESPEIGITNDKLTSSSPESDIIAERKIIKTYDINAETKEFDTTVASLEALVAQYGGYVEIGRAHV